MKSIDKISLMFLLLIFWSQNSEVLARKYDCNHKPIDLKVINATEQEDGEDGTRRNLQTNWQSIRITYSIDDLDGAPSEYSYVKYFIQKLMNMAVQYFEDILQVIPNPYSTLLVDYSVCGELGIPERIRTYGVENSDLHIIVGLFDDSTGAYSNTLAAAGPCFLGGQSIQGRVIMGRILYNLAFLKDGLDSLLDPLEFEDQFEITIHELTHVLGFSGSSIQYWWNPSTNSPYGSSGVNNIVSLQTYRGYSTTLLKTPNVVAAAKAHFGCTTLVGMQLENEGGSGSAGSHWETTISYGETMGPRAISHDSSYTGLTLALLKDTNWYRIQSGVEGEYLAWGKNQGCDFFTKACESTTRTYPEFSYNNRATYSCGFDNFGVSVKTQDDFSDTCQIYSMFSDTLCQDELNILASDTIDLNYYNSQSRCFMSNIIQSGYTSSYLGRCFLTTCTPSGSNWILKVKPQNSVNSFLEYTFYSNSDTANQQIGQRQNVNFQSNVSGSSATYSGYIEAPLSISKFCESFTDSCVNFCSGNGYCRSGTCHCLDNYSGSDCSLKSCQNYYMLYPDTTTSTCVDDCPSGYYGATEGYCLPCDDTQCKAQLSLYLNKLQLIVLLFISIALFRF